MAVSIEDIAKKTNLSIGTVSNYINGNKIREKNRILIEEAIRECGYKVNPFGRTLKTNKSGVIGIMVPNLDDPFASKIVSLVEKNLRQNNYAVMISDTWGEEKSENEVIDFFISRRVEGVIIFPIENDYKRYEVFSENGISCVFIDLKVDGVKGDFVAVNNRKSAKLGVEYLIKNGHRKIAILCGPENLYSADERLKGYLDALKENDIKVNADYIIRGEYSKENQAFSMVMNLILSKDRPTAIFAANYFFTIGAVGAINTMHMRVGEDISLLGFDNLMSQYMFSTKLTMVEQPMDTISVRAARLLLNRIAAPDTECRTELIDGFITIGESIKKINNDI